MKERGREFIQNANTRSTRIGLMGSGFMLIGSTDKGLVQLVGGGLVAAGVGLAQAEHLAEYRLKRLAVWQRHEKEIGEGRILFHGLHSEEYRSYDEIEENMRKGIRAVWKEDLGVDILSHVEKDTIEKMLIRQRGISDEKLFYMLDSGLVETIHRTDRQELPELHAYTFVDVPTYRLTEAGQLVGAKILEAARKRSQNALQNLARGL